LAADRSAWSRGQQAQRRGRRAQEEAGGERGRTGQSCIWILAPNV